MKRLVLAAAILAAISSSAISDGDLAQVAFEDGFNYLKSKGAPTVEARSASYFGLLTLAVPYCQLSSSKFVEVGLKLQTQLPEKEFHDLVDMARKRMADRDLGPDVTPDKLRSFCQGVDKMFTLERY